MNRKAVFLDLNGTLVMPVQVTSPAHYQPLPGSIEAVRLLNEAGFLCPVVTVQSRIAKGVYTEGAFCEWFAALQASFHAQGAHLLGPYLCPHSFKADCACRKPNVTLYLKAAADWEIDCAQSYVVGDTGDDIAVGKAMGAQTGLVQTGWGSTAVEAWGRQADFVGADVLAVAAWIVKG